MIVLIFDALYLLCLFLKMLKSCEKFLPQSLTYKPKVSTCLQLKYILFTVRNLICTYEAAIKKEKNTKQLI